jgi:hypothetical protein
LAHVFGDVGLAQFSGQVFAAQSGLAGSVGDGLDVAADHDVDRSADLFGDPLRRPDVGRHRLVEGGEGPLGGHWRRDVFHGHHPHPFCWTRNALNVTFYVSPNLIEWFWNQIHRYTFKHFLGTNAHVLLDIC